MRIVRERAMANRSLPEISRGLASMSKTDLVLSLDDLRLSEATKKQKSKITALKL